MTQHNSFPVFFIADIPFPNLRLLAEKVRSDDRQPCGFRRLRSVDVTMPSSATQPPPHGSRARFGYGKRRPLSRAF
jgi:hypothetical protein